MFFVCDQDGENSALYRQHVRASQWWGDCGPIRFPIYYTIFEYKRVTCAPGKRYTRRTSDWFKQTWSEEQQKYIDTYTPLSLREGWKCWFKHKYAELYTKRPNNS